jgi:fucose 4-O-acetylase-like acetyltransferase
VITLPSKNPNRANSEKQGSVAVNSTSESYPFVNLIRFVSMMGVVWAHVVLWSPDRGGSTDLLEDTYMQSYIPYKQIFKFSVLCFFIISGFLLGDKITRGSRISYFKRRLDGTIKPYMVAFLLFAGFMLIRSHVLHRQVTESNSFFSVIKFCVFDTFFWYLPNYLVCLFIIMLLRKYLKSWYLGGALLSITMVYTVLTVYTNTYAAGHGTAIFGFIFYLWLGVFIRQQNIVNKILNIKTPVLLIIVLFLFVLSSLESYWLYKQSLPYFNILRVFNQLYALAMFALLVKLGSSKINFGIFDPRKESFGIYLYHGFFVYFLFPKLVIMAKEYMGIEIWTENTMLRLLLITLYAICCYLLTVLLVKLLQRFKLAYL